MSHDLRTPLTSVGVAVTNLQDSRIGEEERQAQARVALQELERLNRIFQDILDMARIDAAGITAERQWVTPADIVDAALANGGALLAERRLNVEAQSDVEVHVDPCLTSNALAHLVENAALYSPPDAAIDVTGEGGTEEVRLTVRDRGLGLDAGELHQLFERFYRGAADGSRQRDGAGDYAWTTGRRGRPGVGRERAWRRRDVHDRDPGRAAAVARPGTVSMPLRILVVDDEPNILATMAPLLRARGYAARPR